MTRPDIPTNPAPLVDLRGLAAGVLWRRKLWGFLAVLGVLVGLLATVAMSPNATAVTKVLIVRADDTVTSQEVLMETDVALFNTAATAAEAARRLDLDVTPVKFAKTFEGEALTANILLISANGPTDNVAVRRADALAKAFIAGHVARARDEAQAQLRALQDRREELQRELGQTGSAGTDTSDDLVQQRAGITAQITTLGEGAQQALAAVPRVEAGTRVVDPPRPLNTSFLFLAVRNIAVGLALGLTAGVALAAALCVTRDRPVLRRDIAAQLDVSIVSELPGHRRARLRRRGHGARVDERVRDTLVRLVGTGSGRVSLLELGCPRTAAALADAMAEKLGNDPTVEVRPVNPGASWTDLDQLGPRALLVVRAGHASTLWLHTVVRRLAEAEITPLGAVLVSPYPWDNTDGALWIPQRPVVQHRWYSVAEVAEMLGFGISKTKGLVSQGRIRSLRIGGNRRVLPEWVDEYIDQQVKSQRRNLKSRTSDSTDSEVRVS